MTRDTLSGSKLDSEIQKTVQTIPRSDAQQINHTHEKRLHQVVGNFYGIGDSGRIGMGVVKIPVMWLLYYLMTHVESVR